MDSFRYPCLVTTSPLSLTPPYDLDKSRHFGRCQLPWCDGRLSSLKQRIYVPTARTDFPYTASSMHFPLQLIHFFLPFFGKMVPHLHLIHQFTKDSKIFLFSWELKLIF